jgi:hypothetical protein
LQQVRFLLVEKGLLAGLQLLRDLYALDVTSNGM